VLRVVIAPDSFKGSSAAADAARALADGWRSVRPGDELVLLPQADGGEGTLDAVAGARGADAVPHVLPDATGPDGRRVRSRWLGLPDGLAAVELAASSGLPLMAAPDPLGATTRGLGETIAAALDAGATRVVAGLGGSASTDGGAGALAALGLVLLDDAGDELPAGGTALARLAAIDRTRLTPIPGGITLLADVDAPLLGPRGAAAVFGPQKGADPAAVAVLERGLARFAELMGGDPAAPGAGAAGGTGYGFSAAYGAHIESGAARIADITGLVAALRDADVVVAGEGRVDAQSRQGKVVGHVLDLVSGTPVRAVVVAGGFDIRPERADGAPVDAVALVGLAGSASAAIADPGRWLRAAGARAAELLS